MSAPKAMPKTTPTITVIGSPTALIEVGGFRLITDPRRIYFAACDVEKNVRARTCRGPDYSGRRGAA
jgi:L-ascorbate metabolism protein UlaG (beta-lactamase superfamily)